MRGARCKALKNAFLEKTGRLPSKTTYQKTGDPNIGVRLPSVWRRLKKAYLSSRRTNG